MNSKAFKDLVSTNSTAIGMVISIVTVISFFVIAPAANARIKCNGQFQVIKGEGEISTSWCQDHYLARIARSYGWKVSDRMVRENPNLKDRICRHIGHDFRLNMLCQSQSPDSDDEMNDHFYDAIG